MKLLREKLNWKNILDKLIELNYLAIIFLIPLWFAYLFPTYNIFELNKIIVFRIFLWTLLFLTILKFISQKLALSRLYFSKILTLYIFPIILVLGLGITIIFSVDPLQSFYGAYERLQGLSSYIFYLLWSLLVFFNLITFIDSNSAEYKEKISRILITSTVSATIVAIYGILQILNIDFVNWPEAPYLTGRTLSSFGQPNFLASFLLLTLPLALYLGLNARKFYLKNAYFFSAFLQLTCLFLTSSRGGLIALILVVGLIILYLLIKSSISLRRKIFVIIGGLVVAITGIIMLEIVTPGRVKESFNPGLGSFAARINFYQAAADAFLQKPIFGYGLENGGEVFIRYYERDWGIYADVSANTDRAHNIVLDIMLSSGILGLILFTLWYYSYFKFAYLEIKYNQSGPLVLVLIAGSLAYLLSLLFGFAIVGAEIYFWLYFAIIASLVIKRSLEGGIISNVKKNDLLKPLTWSLAGRIKIAFVILVGAISFWQVGQNIKSLIADSYFNDMYVKIGERAYGEAMVLHDYISDLNINPVQKEYYNHFLANNLSNAYFDISDTASKKIAKDKLDSLLQELPDKGYKNILVKAKTYSFLGDFEKSDKYFTQIFEITPNWPLAHFERAWSLLVKGDIAQAEKSFLLLDYNLPDPGSEKINLDHLRAVNHYKFAAYNSLADAYFNEGNYKRAKVFYEAAYKSRPSDYSLLKKIADCYYLMGFPEISLKYVQHGLVINPKDYNWKVAAASLNFELNNKQVAIDLINQAIDLEPNRQELIDLKKKYNQ